MTTRTVIAEHKATEANAAWTFERVTGSYANVDEYQLTIGHTALSLDLRHAEDREQMSTLAGVLTSALTVATLEHLESDDEDEGVDDGLCPDTGDHPLARCAVEGCANYVAELESLAPWGTSRAGLKGWAS